MAKTKTASVRLPKEMYEKIDNICDGVGCSRNDWIKDTLQDKLREESNENSQDQEVIRDTEPEPKEESKPSLEEIPEIKEPKIIIKDVPQDNSNKPPIEMVLYNGKYIPSAKRYNL